jgi:transposase
LVQCLAMPNQESIFSSELSAEESLSGTLLIIAKLEEQLKTYQQENAWLKEQIQSLQRTQFGKKSERYESPEQFIFNEVELESSKLSPEEDESLDQEENNQKEITVAAHTKKVRGHRKALPEELAREIIKIELPVAELFSEEGLPLKIIGWEKSEKLKYEPSKISVIQYQRAMYGVDSGDYVKTAPPVPSVIPKGIPSAELLAAIITGKFGDGLPLYRMEEIFKRHGVELSRGSMARWMIEVKKALQPVWNVLSEKWLDSFYVACDETKVQVLKENGRKAESQSWMWVRSTPFGEKKIILFDYSPNRTGAVAKELFTGYEGYLQCDGLASYNCLESEKIIRLGCNMHGRRKFESAMVDGAPAGKTLGEKGVLFYKKIYDIEEEIKEKPPDERYRTRQEKVKPIFEELKLWVESKNKVPKTSKIGKAFHYFLSEYEYLIKYLEDGRLGPDNGFTERAIRKFAIGRNNWMFSDSVDGADASALLYSFVVTAKFNGVNVYKALVKLLTEVPMATTCEDYERLAEIILTPNLSA